MNSPDKDKIISLDDYRKNHSLDEQTQATSTEQSDVRYNAEEQVIIDRLNHPHPAGKQIAFDKLVAQPDLMVRFIQDKLRTNGYTEDEINAVRSLAEYTEQTEANLRPEELSQALYVEYLPLMQTTHERNEQRSAQAAKVNRDAKAARASFRLIDSQNSQND